MTSWREGAWEQAERPARVRLRAVPAVAALLVAGLLLGALALMLGGDRLIECGSRRGLDAVLGDNVSHVDGPEGSGGCIVPTAGAWATAAAATVAPLGTWLLVRRRPEHIEGPLGEVDR